MAIWWAFAADTLSVSAAPVLSLNPYEYCHNLSPFVEYYEDRDGSLDIAQISGPDISPQFLPLGGRILNRGITSSVYWLRFSVRKESASDVPLQFRREWLLRINWPLLTSVRVYFPRRSTDGSWEYPGYQPSEFYQNLPPPPRTSLFRLPDDLDESSRMVYLRIESETPLFAPMEVCSDLYYVDYSNRSKFLLGVFYGIILIIALMNLIQYVSLHQRSYLWHALFAGFIGCYFLGNNGLLHEYLLPYQPVLVARISILMLGAAVFWACQFTRSFLDTRRLTSRLDTLLTGTMAVSVTLMALSPFAPLRLLSLIEAGVLLFMPLLLISTGIVSAMQGFHPARYYLGAWTLFAVGTLMHALMLYGVLPYGSFSANIFQFSALFELIVLQFALFDRMNMLRREREEAILRERRYQILSITDSLTGIFNTRYFRTQLPLELSRADSLDLPLTLLLLDIDDFKMFNDGRGHLAGDRLLTSFGRLLQSNLRTGDIACRYGGEEFAVILPGSSGSVARDIAERIRESFERFGFTPSDESEHRITVSIGVAEHTRGGTYTTLVEAADRALYRAKEQGKNRVITAE